MHQTRAQTADSVGLEPGVSLELAQRRKSTVSDVHYQLDFRIPAARQQRIDAAIVIEFDLTDPDQALLLDFRESEDKILTVSANGQATDGRVVMEHLHIPASALLPGRNRIAIDFIAGETSLNRNPDFLYTLFVPDRARTAFPLFDQPNLKARYELTLTVPAAWQAIGNGPLIETIDRGENKELRFAPTRPIPSYLFSFVAGRFEAISRQVDGREMTLLHRESDGDKVARNVDEIFALHGIALQWLEDYTGIPYPFQKFDFALIPSFQYGGMEHVGAIQYRADSLFLDPSPSQTRLLGRASLIAHETAHMWFGDLVTMDWFDDVWTKEVFANFMAAKIVNPSFPAINHELNFLLRHYPSAYAVDRSPGANPIRQPLPNLNEAGTLYGNIIYNKAPIMMRQLEALIGADAFQMGMREYLATYAYGNATWPDLIAILDRLSSEDLAAWSEVWVNTAGRPHFQESAGTGGSVLLQTDPAGRERIWPQRFDVAYHHDQSWQQESLNSGGSVLRYDQAGVREPDYPVLYNADGYGYGLFPADPQALAHWEGLDLVQRGSLLIGLFEKLLEGSPSLSPAQYLQALLTIIEAEDNQLLLNLSLNQAQSIYWSFLDDEQRLALGLRLEGVLWQEMLASEESSSKKIYFDAYRDIALSEQALGRLQGIWSGERQVPGLILAEPDFISLATNLAIKQPRQAQQIVDTQLSRIENGDRRRRLEFIAPALSADDLERDRFFESLQDERNREIESWVLGALSALHHPLRHEESEKYLLPSLELLEEIQATGDIFFPARWLGASLGNHRSAAAAATVREFLAQRPDYNRQLRLKILQAADTLFRSRQWE